MKSLLNIGLLLLLCGLIAAPSFLVPWWAGRDAPSFEAGDFPLKDAEYAAHLKGAARLEREGRLEDAAQRYREAMKAESEELKKRAAEGVQRVDAKMRLPFSLWSDIELARSVSARARLPIALAVLIYLFILVGAAVERRTLRPGWAIREFSLFRGSGLPSESSFRQSLVESLSVIQWFYQRPSEEMDRLGAKVTARSFLPEEGQGPWADALRSLQEAQGKNLPAFFFEQVIRFMKGYRQRRRYLLSGSVELLPDEARATAQLSDLRIDKPLSRLEASSREASEMEIESASLGRAAARRSIVVTVPSVPEAHQLQLSLEDNKEDQQRLSSLAMVLACKLWFALSGGAQADFQPQSWKTFYHFIRGLQALKRNQNDPTDTAAQEEAVRHLRCVTELLDPFYRPARFFLAFAHLSRGETEAAQKFLASLMEPIEKSAADFLEKVKEAWLNKPIRVRVLRFVLRAEERLGRLLPDSWQESSSFRFFRHWSDLYEDVFVHLHGGKLYIYAKLWERFPKNFEMLEKAEQENDQMGRADFQSYLRLFEGTDYYRYVRIAANLDRDQLSPEEARARLDKVFDLRKIYQVDHGLDMLQRIVRSKFLWAHYTDKEIQEQLAEIAALRDDFPLYEETFNKLHQQWAARDRNSCQQIIRDLRRKTTNPDDFEVHRLLASMEPARRFGWLINRLFPVFREVQRWRETFVRDRLYIESRYYLNLARYQSFDFEKVREAMEDARELHEKLLSVHSPANLEQARREELRKLSTCLEADAAARMVLDKRRGVDSLEKSIAASRLRDVIKKVEPELKKLLSDDSPDVSAAAYATLSLLQRAKRKDETLHFSKKSDAKVDELDYLRKSLKLKSSATVLVLMAEVLEEEGRSEDARTMLAHALKRCPHHALALRLQREWSPPPKEQAPPAETVPARLA